LLVFVTILSLVLLGGKKTAARDGVDDDVPRDDERGGAAHVFGHQSGDDFVHERDDGIGKVHLRERNGNGERGGDRRRGVAVTTAETTNYCRFGAHEPRAKDNRVESKHGRERW